MFHKELITNWESFVLLNLIPDTRFVGDKCLSLSINKIYYSFSALISAAVADVSFTIVYFIDQIAPSCCLPPPFETFVLASPLHAG